MSKVRARDLDHILTINYITFQLISKKKRKMQAEQFTHERP
jgi:hypothetical protein